MTDLHNIVDAVSLPTLCEVVQEECSELAVAVSKLKRAIAGSQVIGYDNPTNITPQYAMADVREEYTDLMLAIEALTMKCQEQLKDFQNLKHGVYVNHGLRQDKLKRWYDRLVRTGAIKPDDWVPVKDVGDSLEGGKHEDVSDSLRGGKIGG